MIAVSEALILGKSALSAQTHALLEAQILLADVLQWERSKLYAWPEHLLTLAQQKQYQDHLQRRQVREPIAYIVGVKEFWSLSFKVTPDTLVPRLETELLVEMVLTHLCKETLTVADLGTGAGTIACALAFERPAWQLIATDICPRALKVAQHNAASLQLANIEFIQSNWLQGIKDKQFDAIVSNPPYIREYDLHLTQGDLIHEPRHALTCDSTGLKAFCHILSQCQKHLKPQGLIAFEHGFDQGQALRELLQQAGFKQIKTVCDIAGLERVTGGYFSPL